MKKLCLFLMLLLVISLNVSATDLRNVPQVRNVILMIGDGMGQSQVALANLVSEALYHQPLAMLTMPIHGFVDTANAQGQVTDSAAGGTAYSIGMRTTNGYVGIDARGDFHFTLFERAKRAGKSRGIVTDMSLMDATPAAFVAHTNSRNNQNDISAGYLITLPEVFFGFDRTPFTQAHRMARGWDNRDLIRELMDHGYAISTTSLGWNSITEGPVAGFYTRRTYPKDETTFDPTEPALSHMLSKALDLLVQYDDGFVLMVEGGSIDSVGHFNDAVGVVAAVLEFDRAVRVALDFQAAHPDTLIVITADHETGGMSLDPETSERFVEVYTQITKSTVTIERLLGSNPSTNAISSLLLLSGFPHEFTERDLRTIASKTDRVERQTAIGQFTTKIAGGATFSTIGHSLQLVPYFASGPNAELLPKTIRNDEMGRFLARSVVGRVDNYWIE